MKPDTHPEYHTVKVIMTDGTGVWTTTQVPTSGATWSTPVTWTDQTVGIENLVANEIIAPPGGNPILASWDRPFFEITDPNTYPLTYGPINSDTITAGWSVDYASSSPSFLVGLADWWGVETTAGKMEAEVVEEINREYAFVRVVQACEEQGYQIAKEDIQVGVDGTVQLVANKWG